MNTLIETEIKERGIQSLKYLLESIDSLEYLKTFCNRVDDDDVYYDNEAFGTEYHYKDDVLIFEIEWSKGSANVFLSEEGFNLILPELKKLLLNA